MEQLCARLRVPNDIRDLAKLVAEYHDLIHPANSAAENPRQTLRQH